MVGIKDVCQTAIIWAIGDTTAQLIQAHKRMTKPTQPFTLRHALERFDDKRCVLAAFYGGVIFAPVAGRWYQHLIRVFPQTTSRSMASRIFCDQVLWSPFALMMYFSFMAVVARGFSIDAYYQVRFDATQTLPGTLAVNWCFWVPVQAMNFFYIRPSRWLLMVNLAAVPWTAYLSLKSDRAN